VAGELSLASNIALVSAAVLRSVVVKIFFVEVYGLHRMCGFICKHPSLLTPPQHW
jgi:hypothetical protein